VIDVADVPDAPDSGLRSLALLILDDNNRPLANVKIVIAGIEAFTDENGVVIFESLTGSEVEVLGVYDNKEFRQTVTLEDSSEVITIILDRPDSISIQLLCTVFIVGVTVGIIGFILIKRRKSVREDNGR
jgi:hypothetical protein